MLAFTMMTGLDDGNHADGPFDMATWDVSRAHFYGKARRWIYTYLPEGHEQESKLARLCRSMYGTRDAASIWGDTWSEVLKDGSMKVGTACSAFFFVVNRAQRCELHNLACSGGWEGQRVESCCGHFGQERLCAQL